MPQFTSSDHGTLLCLRLSAAPDSLNRLATAIASLAERERWDDALGFQVDLILEELVQNVIAYGYPDGREGEIVVSIEREGDLLIFSVDDDGDAFDPLTLPEPDLTSSITERDIGGLGIHFARTYTDEQTYCRDAGRNKIRLCKRISDRMT